MKVCLRLFLCLVCVQILSACSTRIVDYTVISTKNVDISALSNYSRSDKRVTGTDTAHIILGIPTSQPNMKEAIDRAIETTPGSSVLVDGVVNLKHWQIPFIYGQISYVVEGTPLVNTKL